MTTVVPIMRGESVRAITDYDLFDINIRDCRGIYLKTNQETGKLLVYFPVNQEWAELMPAQLERLDPGNISEDNQNFIKNIKTLEYSY